MNQVLHIFRKDLRHHWRACVVYLLLLVGYTYHAIYAWRASGVTAYAVGFDPLSLPREFLRVLVVLIPVAWALMVSGVVHDESLAGTRQFWVTRPYDWKQLFAAKVLFVLVTINMPLLVLGVFLLAKAGFPPLPHFLGLLWMQVMILFMPLLPFAGMATITSKTSQFVLYWFAIPLYYSSLAALAAQIPSSHNGLSISGLSLIVPTAACLVVILIQYARRRTVLSVAIFGTLAVLIAIITVVPSPRETTVPSTYRALAAGEAAPVQLQLIPLEIAPPPHHETRGSDYVQMQIPFSVSGVAPDSIIQLNEFVASIDGPNGLRWNSDLQGSRVEIYPETKETKLVFGVKRDLLDRIGSARINLRITVAFTVFRDTNRRSIVASDGEFTVPGFGICSTPVTPYLASGISCRSPPAQTFRSSYL